MSNLTPAPRARTSLSSELLVAVLLLAWFAASPAVAQNYPIKQVRIIVGLTAGGLPVGLQIVGPYLEDATPIAVAGHLADAIGGFKAPPGF